MMQPSSDYERENKKIQVINITEDGRYAGPQSRIAKVAGLLNDMGIEATVICPAFDSKDFVNELKKSRVFCIPVRLHRLTLQLRHLIGYVFFFVPEVLSLRKLILKHKSDLIHCNGCWQMKGMLAARLAKSDAQVIYHLNDTYTLPVIKFVFSFFAKQWVDAFIPASERSRKYYLSNRTLGAKRNLIIPAPVDTNKFNPDAVTEDLRIAKLPGLKIITVCNIQAGKGLDELVQLCDLLSKQFPKDTLSFCAVGHVYRNQMSYYTHLKQEIKENELINFYFMGSTNEVPAVLKAADIYICASHFESSPMAVWEALAMGRPVISTDVGDVKNHLEQGQCGFCVPVGDIEGMRDKLSVLMKDPAMRCEMGKKARAFAIKNFDLTICAQKHALFYKNLVNGKLDNEFI